MSFPDGLQTVTVTCGPYLDATGVPLVGKSVRLTPEWPLVHEPSGTVVLATAAVAVLDATGRGEVVVPASDAAGLTRPNARYMVRFDFGSTSAPASFYALLPAVAPSVDLDLLVPTGPAGDEVSLPTVTSVAGLSGAVSADELLTALGGVPGGGGGAVASVNGETGVVVLDAAAVGAQPAGDYATSTELATKADLVDGAVPDAQLPARLSDEQLRAAFAAHDRFSAADYSGASVAARITAAATAAAASAPGFGLVDVPTSLRGTTPTVPAASDLNIPANTAVADYRFEKGSITNPYIKGAAQLSTVFGENLVETPVTGSDNGSTLAVEALLTGGSGSNTGTVYGENTALYAGIQRQAGSTRSAWAANLLLTSYQAPADTHSSYGLEIDLSNNSGADATGSTPFDGVAVMAAGSSNNRFGLWVANSGTAKWLTGIMVSDQVSETGIEIAPGIPLGLYSQSPVQLDDYLLVKGSIAGDDSGGLNLTAVGEFGAIALYANNSASKTAQLEANGKMTLFKALSTAPELAADGTDTDIDLILRPKGAGALDLQGATTTAAPAAGGAGALPATPAGYLTVKVGGTSRKVAYY